MRRRRLQVEGLGEAWSPQELNSSVHQREEQVRGGIFVSNACRKKAHLVRRQGFGQGIKEPAPPQFGTVCISTRPDRLLFTMKFIVSFPNDQFFFFIHSTVVKFLAQFSPKIALLSAISNLLLCIFFLA